MQPSHEAELLYSEHGFASGYAHARREFELATTDDERKFHLAVLCWFEGLGHKSQPGTVCGREVTLRTISLKDGSRACDDCGRPALLVVTENSGDVWYHCGDCEVG